MTVRRLTLLERLVPRASARLRLTIAFGLLVFAVGGSIVVSIYLAMTFLPAYDITDAAGRPVSPSSGADGGAPMPTAAPSLGSSEAGGTSGQPGLIAVRGPEEILRLLLTTSLTVFAVVLVAGLAVCWFAAGRVLRPVERITEVARHAAAGSLDRRIALDGPDDEFRRLAETFDGMLERLELSFQAQKRFSANASHELKTPLATTQAILDVALLDPEGIDPENLTRKLRETNKKNIATVEALLALADAQSGTRADERVELADLAREIVATTTEAARERDVTVHTAILETSVKGDPTLIRLLVGNLVGNALRYNVTGGDVWLTVAAGRVRVENTGPVVMPTDLARLREPFFRSAGRVAGSHGLGLALVDAIAVAHDATLDLTARAGGGLLVDVAFD